MQISPSEWEVMKVVWKQSEPSTAQSIISALSKPNHWSAATIKTLINRLVNKGALNYERQGNFYLYTPGVDEQACQAAEFESFMQRVFDGSVSPLMAHFTSSQKLTSAEIDQLEKLLGKALKP
ncbi:MAG: BlaI/MecI/CopY family transcriptional regulator [Opitutaceae bacterium]